MVGDSLEESKREVRKEGMRGKQREGRREVEEREGERDGERGDSAEKRRGGCTAGEDRAEKGLGERGMERCWGGGGQRAQQEGREGVQNKLIGLSTAGGLACYQGALEHGSNSGPTGRLEGTRTVNTPDHYRHADCKHCH